MSQRICLVDECTTTAWARGWCNRHYKRWRRYGDPTMRWEPRPASMPLEKRCSRCSRVLPAQSFWKRSRTSDGLQSACKGCMAEADRQRLYGLSPTEYTEMLEVQGGRCAICRTVPDRPLVVDHCHKTGDVRGLLCGRCNSAIGLLDDDSERAGRAASYLGR